MSRRTTTPRRALVWLLALPVALALACAPTAPSPAAPAAPAASAPAPAAPAANAPAPASAAPAAPSPPPPLQRVTIAVPNKAASQLHVYATKALGLYERQGLDVEISSIPVASTGMAALQAGELDLYTGATTAMNAAIRGLPVRVIMIDLNYADFLLIGAKDLSDVDQLRGKVVAAFGPETFVNSMTAELLRRKGLDGSQYELLNVGGSRVPALVSGIASATLIDTSEALPLMREGYTMLARARDSIEIPFTGLSTSTTTLQAKRDMVKTAVQTTLEGVRTIRDQKDAIVPIIVSEYDRTPEDAEQIYDGLRNGWALDGRPTPGALQFGLALSQIELGLPETPRAEQIYDFSVLDELQARR